MGLITADYPGEGVGFTLSEIKQLVQNWGSHAAIPTQEQIRIIEHKLEEISRKMCQFAEIEAYLTAKLRRLEHEVHSETFPLSQRECYLNAGLHSIRI